GRHRLGRGRAAPRRPAAARPRRRRRHRQGPPLQPRRDHLRRLVRGPTQHRREGGTGLMTTDTDTVEMLRDAMQRYATEQYDFAQRRAFLAEGCSERAWRDYAEFGWLALRLPEDDGGLAADA